MTSVAGIGVYGFDLATFLDALRSVDAALLGSIPGVVVVGDDEDGVTSVRPQALERSADQRASQPAPAKRLEHDDVLDLAACLVAPQLTLPGDLRVFQRGEKAHAVAPQLLLQLQSSQTAFSSRGPARPYASTAGRNCAALTSTRRASVSERLAARQAERARERHDVAEPALVVLAGLRLPG